MSRILSEIMLWTTVIDVRAIVLSLWRFFSPTTVYVVVPIGFIGNLIDKIKSINAVYSSLLKAKICCTWLDRFVCVCASLLVINSKL